MLAAPLANSDATQTSSGAVDAHDQRRRLAARTLADALLLGIVGDALLRVPVWGANLTLWSLATIVAMVTLVRRRHDGIPLDARWLLIPAIAISVMFAWRDAEELAAYNTLALIGTLALVAAASAGDQSRSVVGSRVRDLAHTVITVGLETVFGMLPLVLSDVSLRHVAGGRDVGRAIAVVRAALLAIPLVLIFGALFASADPVFARIASQVFRIDASAIAQHLAVSGIIAWFVGGLLRATVLSNRAEIRTLPFPDGALGLTEVSTALGSLVVLFAAFVAVQLRYFFGGDALVQSTAGMSYADYARRGFFELVTVSALVLPVLLLANALLRRDTRRADRVFRVLASTLLALLAVIIYSAIARMRLYESVYGLSTDRLYATVFMGWLAVVFVWFAATVLRGREKPFAAGVLVSGWATLIALNVANPAALVGRTNVARAALGKELDVNYVARLGGDAAPALVGYLVRQPLTAPDGWVAPDPTVPRSPMPAPNVASGPAPVTTRTDDFTARCEAARRLLSQWGPASSTDWRGWTLGRAAARRAVAANEQALRTLAGTERVGQRYVACAEAPREGVR
jgi:uncharacterized protein DUF4153